MIDFTQSWIARLQQVTASTLVTVPLNAETMESSALSLDSGILSIRGAAKLRIKDSVRPGRFILFGNGGSLATAMHIATDFSLAGWPSIALTDAVALTSHTNDFGPEANFTKQLELMHGTSNDIVVAMSCSGKSPNILDAVHAARAFDCLVITLSGFEPDNPLRLLGDLNFYVPSREYGFVQIAHESILHAACDIENGWSP